MLILLIDKDKELRILLKKRISLKWVYGKEIIWKSGLVNVLRY